MALIIVPALDRVGVGSAPYFHMIHTVVSFLCMIHSCLPLSRSTGFFAAISTYTVPQPEFLNSQLHAVVHIYQFWLDTPQPGAQHQDLKKLQAARIGLINLSTVNG